MTFETVTLNVILHHETASIEEWKYNFSDNSAPENYKTACTLQNKLVETLDLMGFGHNDIDSAGNSGRIEKNYPSGFVTTTAEQTFRLTRKENSFEVSIYEDGACQGQEETQEFAYAEDITSSAIAYLIAELAAVSLFEIKQENKFTQKVRLDHQFWESQEWENE